ncbi:putative FAD-binding oxidoreductase [Escherichia coli]|nr:putative FAD-binding oxidoreductase [Escherichia coli]CTV26744.1 putative FAD-binding oxidoreductase [Escherichia coli]CTW24339.1 putative FAD-binding oxidoreductase [Escherichia coli]CTY62533.1 putative FAD-binding oxidoreductase [Escherichia coli]
MSLSRAAIVDQLKEIVGADRVITDETVGDAANLLI